MASVPAHPICTRTDVHECTIPLSRHLHRSTKAATAAPAATASEASESSASSYTFDNYQDDASTTAFYPGAGDETEGAASYAILGLIGEAGEIANKWKKLYRDAPSFATQPAEYFDFYSDLRTAILGELGDVLWYAARLATELGLPLGEVAAENIRKLNDRQRRGKLGGSGDNR